MFHEILLVFMYTYITYHIIVGLNDQKYQHFLMSGPFFPLCFIYLGIYLNESNSGVLVQKLKKTTAFS